MKYVDGSIYEGMWKENKKHGQGKLQYANGDIYIGQFQNDKCHGTGTIKYKDGTIKDIYCHYDGYLEYNGQMLYYYYRNIEKPLWIT